jgi:uncharacterized protein (DUF58 family)
VIPVEVLRRVRRLEIAARRRAGGTLAGRWRSAFRGRGLLFDEVRPYEPGDEVRAIDWNVTARTGALHVKRFVEERELTVVLLLDVSASMDFGSTVRTKLRAAGEAAALVALAAAAGGDRVGLLPFAGAPLGFVSPRRGRPHALAVAAAALDARPAPGATDLAAALERVRRVVRRRAVLFLLSDFLAPAGWERALGAAALRHDLVAVVVEDRREAEPPASGLSLVEDPETGARLAVDLSDRRVRARHAALRSAAAADRDRALARAGAAALQLDAATADPLLPLVRFLDRRTRGGRHP